MITLTAEENQQFQIRQQILDQKENELNLLMREADTFLKDIITKYERNPESQWTYDAKGTLTETLVANEGSSGVDDLA